MSALTTPKKRFAAIVVAVSAFALTGCSDDPTYANVDNQEACFTYVGEDSTSVELHWYDDEYSAQFPGGECATAQQLQELEEQNLETIREIQADESERRAAEQAAYDADLPLYRSDLQARVESLTETREILEEVITFYCQSTGTGNLRALWDVSEEVFDDHWRADMETKVPRSLTDAISPFCSPQPDGDFFTEKYPPLPEEPRDPTPFG